MDDKLKKKNDFMHFLEKWFVIGIILFIVIQLFGLAVINIFVPKEQRLSEEQKESYSKDYIGHWYNGTFFIEMNVSENFDSTQKYEEMIKEIGNNNVSKACLITGSIFMFTSFVLIIIAAIKEHKNKLLDGHTPSLIIFGGLSFTLYKIIENIDLYIDASYYGKYSKGFLSTASYYPQIYNIFILGTLLIALGLVLRQKQRKDLKKSNKNNKKLIRLLCVLITSIGATFILYRFGVRLYELIMVLIGKDINIRIPFYYFMIELPKSFAVNSSSYLKLVVLRFIKDLPVFISSAISIIMFTKILTAHGNNIKVDNRYYKRIYISLFVSSLILNILGLFEVSLLNAEFLYQYKEAVYTIAIRSLCEPLLYAFYIYLFKHYTDIGFSINKAKK